MVNTTPFETLLALALDLLAQSEARQRVARRLERAADLLVQTARIEGRYDASQLQQVRDHLRTMREYNGVEQSLIEELDRALIDGGHAV